MLCLNAAASNSEPVPVMSKLKSTLSEWGGFFPSLTLVRVVNYFLLLFSHLLSRFTGRFFRWGHPAFFTLEPANMCNLSCPECVTGSNGLKRQSTFLSAADARKVIASLRRHAFVANLYFQGEPALNPELPEMVKACSESRIYSIISTNGQNITSDLAEKLVVSGLKKIVVSLDGITQETYAKYRVRGKLEKVLYAIQALNEARKKAGVKHPFIEVQFIVFRHNEHEVDRARTMSIAAGADRFVLKTAQFYDAARAAEWSPLNARYSRYEKPDTLTIKSRNQKGCFKAWSTYVGCSGGEIAFCCMDKNAHFGESEPVLEKRREHWHSPDMNRKHREISRGKFLPICTNCPFRGSVC